MEKATRGTTLPPRIRVKKTAEANLDPVAALTERGRFVCLDLLQRVDGGRFVLKVPLPRRPSPASRAMWPLFAVALKGRSRFFFPQEEILLAPGEMAILPGDAQPGPAPRGDEESESLVVTLYPQAVALALPPADGPVHVPTPHGDSLNHYLAQIIQRGRRPEWQAKLGAKGLLLAYLSLLEGLLPRPGKAAEVMEKTQIAQTKRLIREELGNPELSVDLLAQRLRCSADYLSHRFRQETGRRLASYINEERITTAQEMLRQTGMTISEIAFAVGFENPGYFARVFKTQTGATPRTYRGGLIDRPIPVG